MNILYHRFREDERPIPEPERRVSFPVPDAMMKLADGIIIRIGSERTWRFDCVWTWKRLLIDEIWIWDDRDPDAVRHYCLDLREDAASREIAAALRRYYEDNRDGQKSLRWYAEAKEEEDASA
jgi:hypothetical protein